MLRKKWRKRGKRYEKEMEERKEHTRELEFEKLLYNLKETDLFS